MVAVDAAMDELGILALQQRRPDTISGGQQQRVTGPGPNPCGMANRQLLLFDEPFSALDPDTEPIVLIASNILWLVKHGGVDGQP